MDVCSAVMLLGGNEAETLAYYFCRSRKYGKTEAEVYGETDSATRRCGLPLRQATHSLIIINLSSRFYLELSPHPLGVIIRKKARLGWLNLRTRKDCLLPLQSLADGCYECQQGRTDSYASEG